MPEQLQALATLTALDDGTEKLLIQQDLDGRPVVRQLGDARDVAQGILPVLERPEAAGEAFNIGASAPFSAEELVQYVARRTSLPVVSARLHTARSPWYTSSAKARAMLGYQPSHGVFDMVDEAIAAGVP